jgi:hypothetical protein
VPAIADLAAPGRPDVDAVVTREAPPARRRPRPSRRMRARADEMARVLASSGRRPRRGLSSVPAAAAVMAAVAIGGVGIALGLDAQRAGQQVALPEIPEVPAERTPVDTGPGGHGGTTTTAGTSLLDAADDGDGTAARRTAEPSAAAAPRATRGAPATTARPRATAPTRADEPTSSTSTPRSTTSVRPSTRAEDPDDPAPRDRRATVGSRGIGDLEPGSGSGGDDATAD